MSPLNLKKKLEILARAQAALVGLVVVMLVGFYFLGVRPAQQRVESLRVEVESKKRGLEADQVRAGNLPVVALEVERLRERLAAYDKKLPSQQELGQFIRDITQVIEASSLTNLTYQPDTPRRNDLYGRLPIRLRFEGDFMNVCSFLRQTESMQRLTRVQEMKLKSLDSAAGRVDVQVLMDIYFTEG